MKLGLVRLLRDVYDYTTGESLSGSIAGEAHTDGPWVIVKRPNGKTIVIWGGHLGPTEVVTEDDIIARLGEDKPVSKQGAGTTPGKASTGGK